MRFHQSWYRHAVLGLEPGPNPNARGMTYGNMLREEDDDQGGNFLTREIFGYAADRYPELGKAREASRVRRNLLSSEPMCFNLFGPLKSDPDLATRLMRCLEGFPADATVIDVRFEYAPDKAAHLDDGTSFDAFVIYERPYNVRGLVGIETKLTEPFSQDYYTFSERYSKWMAEADWWWKAGVEDRFSELSFNQLWRNHLLAYSILRQPAPDFQEGYCAVVYPTEDTDCSKALATYKTLLTENGITTLLDWPLATIVSSWEQALNGKEGHDWITQFKLRYLDLEASENEWQSFVRNII
jgi:hypothetical protein